MAENNKKSLAEELKKHLNSPEYVAVPDLLRSSDYGPDLTYHDGEWIIPRRKFIDFEKERNLIYYDQLEPTDWKEIINLIEKRNQERKQNYQAKKKKIEEKVNNQPGLFYYYGSVSKENRWNSIIDYGDKKGRYFGLWGSENGRSFYLNINSNHSVLDNFPWGKQGFYLIETDKPIERNDGIIRPWSSGGESNENNFHKWVEIGDKISIIPCQVETNHGRTESQETELDHQEIKDCDICQKNKDSEEKWYIVRKYHGQISEMIYACSACYKNKEQEYLENYESIFSFPTDDGNIFKIIKRGKADCYAGKKDQNGKILQQQNCQHCQPWNRYENSNPDDKEIIKLLLQYFQQHNIKKIKLINGELVIEYNGKETKKETVNSQELQLVQNIIQEANNQELTTESLNNMINADSALTEKPKDNSIRLIIGISGALIIGIMIGLVAWKKKKSKNN